MTWRTGDTGWAIVHDYERDELAVYFFVALSEQGRMDHVRISVGARDGAGPSQVYVTEQRLFKTVDAARKALMLIRLGADQVSLKGDPSPRIVR